jgi:hypothetical protein
MKYAVEMGQAAMIYIPSFIKICSGIQTLIRGIQTSLLLFFSIRKIGKKHPRQI